MRHFNVEKEDTRFEILTSALAENTCCQLTPWPLYSWGKRVPTVEFMSGMDVFIQRKITVSVKN